MSKPKDSQNGLTDEQQLLASVGASRQHIDVYEKLVLRDATHQLAPELSGIAFPDLAQLAPSYTALHPYNPTDLPHVHAVLTRVRRQLQHSTGSEQENLLLHLKEQVLLHFLQSVAKIAPEELPIRRNEELAAEQRRSRAIQLCQQESSKNEQSKEAQESPKKAATLVQKHFSSSKNRARIPMMKRKREKKDDDEQDEDVAQRKEHLKRLRQERKRRKEERRQVMFESSSSEEELEFDAESEQEDEMKDDTEEEKKMDAVEEFVTVGQDSAMPSVSCPLCQQLVLTPDPSEADSVLSFHMDQCQRRRPTGSRRSTRGMAVEPSYTLHDDVEPPSRPKRKSTLNKKAKPKRAPAITVPRTVPGVDDLDERRYEDRVDDWIENGLSRMKDMKERDKNETLPGAEELKGGLYLPAWINDRLFGYQRTGLRWMWELHLQEAGGIVGDGKCVSGRYARGSIGNHSQFSFCFLQKWDWGR